MKIKKRKILEIIILLFIMLILSAFVKAEAANEDEFISMNLKGVDLETALIMLADTTGKNLICSSSVNGELTVIFNDIRFTDALDLITDSFDLSYSYENEVIYVSSNEDFLLNSKIRAEEYEFKHISSERAAEILKDNFTDIKIIDLNSNGLIIKANELQLQEIAKIIFKIDKPQKQIKIKARVEEISRTKLKKLGINPNELSEFKIIKNDEEQIEKLRLSWPETLKALNEEGLSNILANPSLMTVDRKKAKLIIGDQIPVKLERVEDDRTISTINYIEAGIVLEFLPKIINNNEVLLEIRPSVNSIGQVVADGLPAVNSRSAETTVILKNKETLAIGGLIKKDELKTKSEVPILSELPILGNIFSAEKKNKLETELIIFITPEIIAEEEFFDNKKVKSLKINKKDQNNKNKKKENKGVKKNKDNRGFIELTEKEIEEILNK